MRDRLSDRFWSRGEQHRAAVPQNRPQVLMLVMVLLLACWGCEARLGGAPGSQPDIAENVLVCGGTTTACGGTCVDTATDDAHCGGCEAPCATGTYCSGGVCTLNCGAGQTACNGTCQLTVSDALHCGGCGLPCGLGQFCDDGACAAACTGTLCPLVSGVDACVHLDRNPQHCGACGATCQAGQECSNGICVASCPAGRTRCGDQCVDVRSTASHCGSCTQACAEGVACVDGACGADASCQDGVCACDAGEQDCSGVCVDTTTNAFHCGSCDIECPTGQVCEGGLCICAAEQLLCGTSCVDAQSDEQNCGGCGTSCGTSESCVAGSCVCDLGLEMCEAACTDLQNDTAHCGTCNNACASHEACIDGLCKFEEDSCGGQAVGIALDQVLLYQAVETELFVAGQMVAADERTVDVVAGREAMVRVFVSAEPGFSGREMSARVFLENGETTEAFYEKKVVNQSSTQPDLTSTFNISIPAESLGTSTRYWVELVECDVPPVGEVGVVRVPSTQSAELFAIETGTIRVALLPLEHDGRVPLMGEESVAEFARAVESTYPTAHVEATVLPAAPSGQSGAGVNWTGLLQSKLQPLRQELGLDDDQYLYAVIEPAETFNAFCNAGGTGSCTAGIAYVVDQLGYGAADFRVGVGVGFGERGAATFAHELGHNHGQCHAPCGIVDNPNDSCDVDPNFPHPQATLGAWGYDLVHGELKNPNEHVDFMSYCSPTWVSDYAYNRYASRITQMNAAPQALRVADGGAVSDTYWARMTVTTQSAEWLPPVFGPRELFASPKVGVVYDESGNAVLEVDVYQIYLSEGLGYELYVPPQEPGWYAVGLKGGLALAY